MFLKGKRTYIIIAENLFHSHLMIYIILNSCKKFASGWALKEFQKNQKEKVKRMSPKVKGLLEIVFHIGTLNPNHKMSAENMYEELLERLQVELEEEELPKISTIANLITRTYTVWEKKWQNLKFTI